MVRNLPHMYRRTFIILGEALTVVDPKEYALCKDAYCIPSKTRIGEADEGEISGAFEVAYRAEHPGKYFI